MKIGILTFHNADNYGAVLQCYALQEKLKELHPDDEVFVIDYKCHKIVNSYIPRFNFKRPWDIWRYFHTAFSLLFSLSFLLCKKGQKRLTFLLL